MESEIPKNTEQAYTTTYSNIYIYIPTCMLTVKIDYAQNY